MIIYICIYIYVCIICHSIYIYICMYVYYNAAMNMMCDVYIYMRYYQRDIIK